VMSAPGNQSVIFMKNNFEHKFSYTSTFLRMGGRGGGQLLATPPHPVYATRCVNAYTALLKLFICH